jgi:hypothetical protein
MHLVQILLPVYGNDGKHLLRHTYDVIRDELLGRFGGLTAFTQSPAEGLWTPQDKRTRRDEVVIIEVMVEDLDRSWWESYRDVLQKRLSQECVVVRVLPMEQI